MLYYIKVLFEIFDKKEKIKNVKNNRQHKLCCRPFYKMFLVNQTSILPTQYYLKSIRFRKYQKAFQLHCFGDQTKVLKNVF